MFRELTLLLEPTGEYVNTPRPSTHPFLYLFGETSGSLNSQLWDSSREPHPFRRGPFHSISIDYNPQPLKKMKEHYLPEIRNSRLEPRKFNLDSEDILEKVVIPKVSKNFGELARDPPSLFLHWPRVLQLGAGRFGALVPSLDPWRSVGHSPSFPSGAGPGGALRGSARVLDTALRRYIA